VPGPSRRFVATVLFTDVVGSTETASEVGDRRWAAILRTYYEVARREVRRFHGREIDTAGDGFFAAFEAPNDGVRCATAIVESLWARGIPIRAGLHAGECEVVGKKVGGIAVHIGARVAGLAGPGQVLVTGTVRDLAAGSALQFEPQGAKELKGVPGEWNVFEVEPGAPLPDLPPLEAPPQEPPRRGGRRRPLIAPIALAVAAAATAVPVVLLNHSGSPGAVPTSGTTAGASPTAGASSPAPEASYVGAVSLDPRSGKVTGRIPIAFTQNSVPENQTFGSGFGFLWVGDWSGSMLYKVNPSTHTVVGSIHITTVLGEAVTGHDVWIPSGDPRGGDRFLLRVDARTNKVASQLKLPACCGGIVVAGGSLWVLGEVTLTRIDLATGVRTSIAVGGQSITAGDGEVWLLDRVFGTATPVDVATGKIAPSISLPGNPYQFAYGAGALWVADTQGGVVWRVPVTKSGTIDRVRVGQKPTDVAVGAGSVWVANSGDDTVAQIEPLGATVLKTIPVEGSPSRVTVAFGEVWVTDTPPA
jgi:YVTN family beta-propeller protein